MTYPEVFSKLTYETATVIFMKKDGAIRIMLATRNLHTVELEYGFQGKALGGHDNRCNIKNGNVAIFDIILGEARSFSINRLVSIEYHGAITVKEELDNVVQKYMVFKRNYEATQPMELTMDMLN